MSLRKSLTDALKRSNSAAISEPFQYLMQPARYKVNYGSRGGGRSWNYGRGLILRAHERKTRILCAREIQSSISESVHRLLSDQIEMLGLSDFFEIQTYTIIGRNGSEFIFEGLRANVSKIKSLEGIDIVWVEEAETISEHSWSTLIPTIRKPGSEIWITFNPYLASDPTYRRFVESPPPNAVVKKTTWRDNPHFPAELEAERLYLQSVDDDAYRWIWEGECRTVSDAQILRGKFHVEPFDVHPQWSGPHFGLDFGFSRDPSAAVQLYIDDATRTLYVKSEYWALGTDIDVLPSALEYAIPGISQHVVFCDNSRPESISYLSRNGIPNARAADKWSGSVNDGVAYLRSFERIVVDPQCKRFLEECRTYSYRVDRLTGLPLPEVLDANNHLMDAARYALSPLIRNLPMSGFFSRSALLVDGKPLDEKPVAQNVYGVLTTTDRAGSAAGLVIFATSPTDVPSRLVVVDYLIGEVNEVLTTEWLTAAYKLLQEHAKQYRMLTQEYPSIFVEATDFGDAVHATCLNQYESGEGLLNVWHMRRGKHAPPIPSLDDRAAAIRSTVNGGGGLVKLSRTAFDRQVSHRNTTANHLLSQVLSYRAEAKEMPRELVAAFCIGVGIWIDIEHLG